MLRWIKGEQRQRRGRWHGAGKRNSLVPWQCSRRLYTASIWSRPPVINIQILQLFSCLKCTRQQILSTLRRQRSLATVLPIGTERHVCLRVCLSIIMGCRGERGRGRDEGEVASSQTHNATSFCALAEPAGQKLSACSRDPNHPFLTTRKEKKLKGGGGVLGGLIREKEKIFLWITELRNNLQNNLLWAECCLVSFFTYNSLNRHTQWNSRS